MILDHAAAVLLDLWIGELAAQHPQPFERAFLVDADEPRIAHDIGRQDRRQPALYPLFAHCPALPNPHPARDSLTKKGETLVA